MVEDSTGWYEMDGGSFPAGTRWLAEVSGWNEMASRSFRLVRDGWLKSSFLVETGRLEGGNGERQAGCPT